MPELEIHHESGHAIDPIGQRVGVLAAALAVLLAVVTIASHRTHTAAIIHKANANDAWQHYQSTRVKYHNLESRRNSPGGAGCTKQRGRQDARRLSGPKEEVREAATRDFGRSPESTGRFR